MATARDAAPSFRIPLKQWFRLLHRGFIHLYTQSVNATLVCQKNKHRSLVCLSVHTMRMIVFLCLQNSILVEIPPYRNQRLSTPVHVNFYVCNGKRKRSQYQRFTYVPASGKGFNLLLK